MLGYIANGVYIKGQPTLEELGMLPQPSPLAKAADQDMQRWEHQRDLIQPYDASGKPNLEFIETYPEESKAYGLIKEPTEE